MAHKKAAGSAKNLRDSNPKYRGVKVYGGQPVAQGSIIIRQKGDKYKTGQNAYVGKDFTIHAAIDGVVSFFKKRVKRYDGRKYLKTFVDVLPAGEQAVATEPAKAPAKKTTPKVASKKAAPATTDAPDLSKMKVAELTQLAKDKGLTGYSSLKKADLIALIQSA